MNKPLSGRRVLLVEDEMVLAWMLESLIADLGCTVVGPVARVKEALALIESTESLDGVVLDVNLNGI
jgi:CheY-like chemotaxis protein